MEVDPVAECEVGNDVPGGAGGARFAQGVEVEEVVAGASDQEVFAARSAKGVVAEFALEGVGQIITRNPVVATSTCGIFNICPKTNKSNFFACH
jgi:hypothetical protein